MDEIDMSDQTGASGGFGSMPSVQPEPQTATGPAPTSVTTAVQLMFVGAALGVLGTIMTIVNKDEIRQQIIENNPNVQNIDAIFNGTVVFGVVVGVVSTLLWIWLALMVRKGRNWARIVTWVLAAISLLLTAPALFNPLITFDAILSAINGILAIAIIVLLTMRTSNEFFRRTP
jgi:hypothetical protein